MWTMDNTEGYTQSELNAANAIAMRIRADHAEIDERSINDALTDAYVSGIKEAAWEAQARKYLGIH